MTPTSISWGADRVGTGNRLGRGRPAVAAGPADGALSGEAVQEREERLLDEAGDQ